MTSGLVLLEATIDSPDAVALVTAVQAEYVARYGSPDETPVDTTEFTAACGGAFLVGYLGTRPVTMGGFRRHDGATAEIKRMYVDPDARGHGLSRLMLAALEDGARAAAYTRVILETGLRQPEAISLYETSGYQRIDGFGHYADEPLSVSFAKDL